MLIRHRCTTLITVCWLKIITSHKGWSMQEARTKAALAEVQSRQVEETLKQESAERAQKKAAKKARRQQAQAAGVGFTFHAQLGFYAWHHPCYSLLNFLVPYLRPTQ